MWVPVAAAGGELNGCRQRGRHGWFSQYLFAERTNTNLGVLAQRSESTNCIGTDCPTENQHECRPGCTVMPPRPRHAIEWCHKTRTGLKRTSHHFSHYSWRRRFGSRVGTYFTSPPASTSVQVRFRPKSHLREYPLSYNPRHFVHSRAVTHFGLYYTNL